MFSKKPASPPAPWAVRVLTPTAVVDGYADTEAHPETWPFFTPHRYPFAAALTVGPFIIRGQLMTEYEGRSSLATLTTHLSLLVQEAEIECRLPVPPLPAFKAPIVLVRTLLLQGMVV